MTYRDDAIRALRDLNQKIFEALYDPYYQFWYVTRDGKIERHTCVNTFFELGSVYYNEPGCPERLATTGLGSYGCTEDDPDYRELIEAPLACDIRPGAYYGEHLIGDEIGPALDEAYPDGLWWYGDAWQTVGGIAYWGSLDIDEPAIDMIEVVQQLDIGWFDDEVNPPLDESEH